MKKICYLLCMICGIGVFGACSDDDDELDALVPVTEIVVPAKVQAGGELIIAGNGFAQNCKIILKNNAQSFELTVAERLSSSIGCIVPKTLTPGEYTVVLVQSGEWALRKITVLEEGAPDPNAPVSSLLLPKDPLTVGEEVTIQGIGFAKDCEIWLKVGEERQKMEIVASNKDVKFKLPVTLVSGVYLVILKQDGGEWVIGEITVEVEVVTTRIKIDKITERWTRKGEDHVVVNTYTYDTEDRIISIKTVYDGDPDSEVIFTWDENLTVELYSYFDGEKYDDPDMICVYTLDVNGRALQSNMDDYISDWTYADSEGGYLNKIVMEEGQYEYFMQGDRIYGYADGFGEYEFAYENEVANKCCIDLMSEILSRCNIEGKELYYGRIAGISGTTPGLLPSSVVSLGEIPEEDYPMGSMEYDIYEDGYIKTITFDDGHVLEVTYK